MMMLGSIADTYQGLARARPEPSSYSESWAVTMAESGDIQDDGWLETDGLRKVSVSSRLLLDRHVLRPYDVIITARTGIIKVALVRPDVTRTVAGITLLVIRPRDPGHGMGHWIWFFLTSGQGREQLSRRMTVNSTTTSLSARSVAEIEIPVPSPRELDGIASLVEASEDAYTKAMHAVRIRREAVRDSLIENIRRRNEAGGIRRI
ncbi:MAG: hypothetical protein F4X20_08135 [Dehalococcoidia bacterium]|nr:hypothetical protein [Dehalococcoidia bacterium]